MKAILYTAPDTIEHVKKRAWLKEFANNPLCMGHIRLTCSAAKISSSTYYGWLHDDLAFAAEVKEAAEFAIEKLENRLDRAALSEDDMNVTAAIFRLKRLKPAEYRERYEVTLTRAEREARIAELLGRRTSPLPVSTNGEHTNGSP